MVISAVKKIICHQNLSKWTTPLFVDNQLIIKLIGWIILFKKYYMLTGDYRDILFDICLGLEESLFWCMVFLNCLSASIKIAKKRLLMCILVKQQNLFDQFNKSFTVLKWPVLVYAWCKKEASLKPLIGN